MAVGVVLILASTLAHNGSAILFAAESRRHPSSPWLLLSISRRARGARAVVLNFLAWALEVAALTLVSLTLTRLVNVAGLALVLLLSRKMLHERVGPREISGVLVIALGTLAALAASPKAGGTTPSPSLWLLILALSLPIVFLPGLLRATGVASGPALAAIVAGFAYALGGVLNKGLADGLSTAARPLLVVGVAVVAAIGLWGFLVELDALQRGRASMVVPVVLALHTILPILCAPFLFGETPPGGFFDRSMLGGGVVATIIGIFIVAGSPRKRVGVEGEAPVNEHRGKDRS